MYETTDEHLPESIIVTIVCRLKLDVNEVNGAVRSGKEEKLHHCVVRRYKRSPNVEVSSSEDKRIQYLRLSRYS